MATRYTELTGCRVPVQQAPMGSVSTTALAVAVAQAGGVGSITVLGMSPGQVDKVLGGMAARTDGVLAANFLTGDIDPEAVAARRWRRGRTGCGPGPGSWPRPSRARTRCTSRR